MKIKVNNLVRFKKGLYEDEEEAIYRVVEINGDRAFIEMVNTDMDIKPQSIAMVADLEHYDDNLFPSSDAMKNK